MRRAQLGQCRSSQLGTASLVTRRCRGASGAGEELGEIHADPIRGIRDPRPELDDAAQVDLGFRVGGHLVGSGNGGERCDERPRDVLRGHRVVGDLAGPSQLTTRR